MSGQTVRLVAWAAGVAAGPHVPGCSSIGLFRGNEVLPSTAAVLILACALVVGGAAQPPEAARGGALVSDREECAAPGDEVRAPRWLTGRRLAGHVRCGIDVSLPLFQECIQLTSLEVCVVFLFSIAAFSRMDAGSADQRTADGADGAARGRRASTLKAPGPGNARSETQCHVDIR
jgi:hypothetical protein